MFCKVSLLAEYLEKWEKHDINAELILIKASFVLFPCSIVLVYFGTHFVLIGWKQGSGRAFSAGGDLKMFYDGRNIGRCVCVVILIFFWIKTIFALLFNFHINNITLSSSSSMCQRIHALKWYTECIGCAITFTHSKKQWYLRNLWIGALSILSIFFNISASLL